MTKGVFIMKACGKVHKYGDNVDTDVIIPARYLNTPDMQELAQHCMEDIDVDFAKNVQKGDIMVAKSNFGCGSSREHDEIERVNDEKGDERIGERDTGVEPASQAWEARALPMC